MDNALKRITLFVGNYGSGKTEIALESAFWFSREQQPVAMVDFDIVNPYFRSAEHAEALKDAGVRVIMPLFAMTTVDVPSLPPDVLSVFVSDERVVFDVGGDEVGAVALGQYAERFDDYDMLFVVNARRPLSSTPVEIAALISRVESRSGLKCTGLVNNTNLANETSLNDLIFGEKVLGGVSELTGLPVRYVCAKREILDAYAKEGRGGSSRLVPLEIRMRRDWMDI